VKRIIYIPFDQLNVEYGAMKIANRGTDLSGLQIDKA